MITALSQNAPISNGVVTVNVLLDWLGDFDVEMFPSESRRILSWVAAPCEHAPASPFPENETLYLLNSDNANQHMMAHPQALGLLVLHCGEPLSARNLPFDAALIKRLVIVRERPGKGPLSTIELLSNLQSRFFKMFRWAKTLEKILHDHGTMQDLVDATEDVLQNYLDVNDATYSLVAYTKHIEAVDTLSKELQALGCHSKLRINNAASSDIFGEWRAQRGVRVFDADDLSPFPYVTKVMRYNDEYQGHVVMVCSNAAPTKGLVDLFTVFAHYCEALIRQACGPLIEAAHPAQSFITKLLTDTRCPQAWVENQLLILEMEDDTEFRVATIDFKASRYLDNVALLFCEMRKTLNAAHAIIFPFEERLVVLFHGKTWSRDTSTADAELLRDYCEKYGCVAFMSDRFHNIRHVRFAYQQTLYAQKYRNFIDIELRPLDNIDHRRLFHFEEAFCFYCYENGTDDEFGAFCTSHTILDEMLEDDQGHEVGDIKILYFFLFNERKATPTAQQLHMHRNNVLYRIGSIEKRYGLDLSRYETRQRLLNCFRIKIMTSWQFRNMLAM